jgi:hypothetical protein
MLIRKPQVHIISREVTLATGELVRAFFAIVEMEGVREIKFLGTRPIEGEMAQGEVVLALPEAFRRAPIFVLKALFAAYVSPYVSTLLFLNSQPARAPSRNY